MERKPVFKGSEGVKPEKLDTEGDGVIRFGKALDGKVCDEDMPGKGEELARNWELD